MNVTTIQDEDLRDENMTTNKIATALGKAVAAFHRFPVDRNMRYDPYAIRFQSML